MRIDSDPATPLRCAQDDGGGAAGRDDGEGGSQDDGGGAAGRDDGHRPHALNQPGGNYIGYFDFHLSEGTADVIVLYMPHRTNSIMRLVRIGEHSDLLR